MDAGSFPRNPVLRFDAMISAAYSRLLLEELKDLQLILREYTKLRLRRHRESRVRAAQMTMTSRLQNGDTHTPQQRHHPNPRTEQNNTHVPPVAKKLVINTAASSLHPTPRRNTSLDSLHTTPQALPVPDILTSSQAESLQHHPSNDDFLTNFSSCGTVNDKFAGQTISPATITHNIHVDASSNRKPHHPTQYSAHAAYALAQLADAGAADVAVAVTSAEERCRAELEAAEAAERAAHELDGVASEECAARAGVAADAAYALAQLADAGAADVAVAVTSAEERCRAELEVTEAAMRVLPIHDAGQTLRMLMKGPLWNCSARESFGVGEGLETGGLLAGARGVRRKDGELDMQSGSIFPCGYCSGVCRLQQLLEEEEDYRTLIEREERGQRMRKVGRSSPTASLTKTVRGAQGNLSEFRGVMWTPLSSQYGMGGASRMRPRSEELQRWVRSNR